MSHAWDEERVKTLRKLSDGKRSAREIASILGVSRNAIIGQARRLGVKLSGPPGGRVGVKLSPRLTPVSPLSQPVKRTCGEASMLRHKLARKRGSGQFGDGETAFARRVAVAREADPAPPETDATSRYASAFKAIPCSRPVSIGKLTATSCRWPLWDLDASSGKYCGAQCQIDDPYCDAHRRLSGAPRGPVRAPGSAMGHPAGASFQSTPPHRERQPRGSHDRSPSPHR